MNIYINNYCNQKCPYCFASDYMEAAERKNMTFGNFKKVLDFLKKSNFMRLRLEGGESTLHPLFEDFIDFALSKGFAVDLFTNGLFSKEIQKFLYLRKHYIHYTWNINRPSFYRQDGWIRLRGNLAKLTSSNNSIFGVNIYKVKQDLGYMYDLCEEFKPHVLRYVFAHRTGGNAKTTTIHPQDLHKIIPEVIKFTKRVGEELGIRLIFDCGFIPCVWPDSALAVFIKYGTEFNICTLCPGVDPDLNVSHCFHTYKYNEKKNLAEFKSMKESYLFLKKIKDKYQDLHLFRKCKNCISRKLQVCDGGCLGDRKAVSKGWVS